MSRAVPLGIAAVEEALVDAGLDPCSMTRDELRGIGVIAGSGGGSQEFTCAGLVQRNIQGRTHTCRLDARPMHGGFEWMRHNEKLWNQRHDVLEARLNAEDAAARGAKTEK